MVDDEDYWPTKNDEPFKSDEGCRTNACVSWVQTVLGDDVIADAFKEVADMVVTSIERSGQQRCNDAHLYPIAYLYRHYLELKLKNMLADGIRLKKIRVSDNVMGDHDIGKLWEHFRRLLTAMKMRGGRAPLVGTEKQVLAFHEIDRSGQGFRYRAKKRGGLLLGSGRDIIGLVNLRKVMDKVHRFLDGCESCLKAALDGA